MAGSSAVWNPLNELIKDVLNAFPSISKYIGPTLALLGIVLMLANGVKGVPLFILGLLYSFLPILQRKRIEKKVLYPTLLAGAVATLTAAIAYYVAIAPLPSGLEASGYYSLVGLSLALFLAAVADISILTSRKVIEDRVFEMRHQLLDEAELALTRLTELERRMGGLEESQAEVNRESEQRSSEVIERLSELKRLVEEDEKQSK